ncbi:MAG: metal ABC transporter solute-binding protein, Zn/Mn family [Propioniciclava sp.]
MLIRTTAPARRLPTLLLVPAAGLGLAACASPSAPASPEASGAATFVATTTQLGSITQDITSCGGGTATTLMGPGDDPHEFAISSAQVADLVRADLVVANGLELETSLESSLENAVADGATLYEVAPELDPLSYADLEAADDTHDHAEDEADHSEDTDHAEDEADHDPAEDTDSHETDTGEAEGDDHDHGTYDPHVFLDAGRMATAAELIGAKIAEVTGDDAYVDCGTQVATQLRETDTEVRDILSAIPEERRVLLTDHEAYNYFADTYDFHIAGVVVPGGGTDAEPSSAELAALVEVIQEEKVHVLFSNNALSPQVLDALADEAGGDVEVVSLYTGSLGEEGSGAETYSGMMLTNAQLIADALA